MKKILLLLFFGIYALLNTKAQSQKHIVVLDSNSFKPISYTTIQGGKNITYADINGKANINFEASSYTISSIGFQTKSITYNLLKDTIFLSPQVYQLKEVFSQEEKKKFYYKIGYDRERHLFSKSQVLTPNFLYASYIAPKDSNSIISELIFKIKPKTDHHYFNVSLFTVGKNNLPSNTIYQKKILVQTNKKNFTITHHIESERIQIPPEGIFVGISYISEENNKAFYPRLKMTTKLDSNLSFVLYKNQWRENNPFNSSSWNGRIGLKMVSYK